MLQNAMRALKVGTFTTFTFVASVAASAETLHDALVGAYKHSGLLEQNRALLRAADEDVAQAVAALRPIINWSASVSRNITDTRTSATPVEITSASTSATTASAMREMTAEE